MLNYSTKVKLGESPNTDMISITTLPTADPMTSRACALASALAKMADASPIGTHRVTGTVTSIVNMPLNLQY